MKCSPEFCMAMHRVDGAMYWSIKFSNILLRTCPCTWWTNAYSRQCCQRVCQEFWDRRNLGIHIEISLCSFPYVRWVSLSKVWTCTFLNPTRTELPKWEEHLNEQLNPLRVSQVGLLMLQVLLRKDMSYMIMTRDRWCEDRAYGNQCLKSSWLMRSSASTQEGSVGRNPTRMTSFASFSEYKSHKSAFCWLSQVC